MECSGYVQVRVQVRVNTHTVYYTRTHGHVAVSGGGMCGRGEVIVNNTECTLLLCTISTRVQSQKYIDTKSTTPQKKAPTKNAIGIGASKAGAPTNGADLVFTQKMQSCAITLQ